jgi:autotransporter family porin
VQGQILGATTFSNAGTIDLEANPAVGDVLLITGGHMPGANGGGTYISNGGFLKLDTVLNDGLRSASQSDVLVVDGTSVGSGATKIVIHNAGGAGSLTGSDGGGTTIGGPTMKVERRNQSLGLLPPMPPWKRS